MTRGWDIEWPTHGSVSVALPLEFYIGAPPIVTGVAYRLITYIAYCATNSQFQYASNGPQPAGIEERVASDSPVHSLGF